MFKYPFEYIFVDKMFQRLPRLQLFCIASILFFHTIKDSLFFALQGFVRMNEISNFRIINTRVTYRKKTTYYPLLKATNNNTSSMTMVMYQFERTQKVQSLA